MKIVHALGWYFPDSLGGTEVYVAGLCRRLRAAGHDVHVAAPQAGRSRTDQYLHDNIPVFRYPVPADPTRAEAQGLVRARGAELFAEWLAHERPDVLHLHSLVTGLGLHELRRAHELGIPVVLTHHLPSLGYVCRMGTLMEDDQRPCDGLADRVRCARCVLVSRGLSPAMAGILAALPSAVSGALGTLPGAPGTALGMAASIERDAARRRELWDRAAFQVVLNDVGRNVLVANGAPAARIVINRLGTDHQSVKSKPGPVERPTRSPIRIGYLGRIDGPKGVRELLLAATRLTGVPFSLEIVGPPPAAGASGLFQTLQRIAATDSRVRLRDAVPSAQVPAVLAEWDVLCCPSTGFENGPTVALEAMAAGTPLIASRIGNLPEIIEDGVNGRLVPPGDIEALAAAIREIAEQPSTIDLWRNRLGVVRSMNQIASDYLALYSRVEVKRARAS